MSLVHDDELLPIRRLDDQRREEEVHVQMAVEDASLPRPALLGTAPASAEADVDDPGAPPLPFEAAGGEPVDIAGPADLGIRADRDLPEPEEPGPGKAGVLRALRFVREPSPGVAVGAAALDALEPAVLELEPDTRERPLEVARRPRED